MIFFFFGSEIFIVLGIGILILLAIGGEIAVWLVEHAVAVGVVLLPFWIVYTVRTFKSLVNMTRSRFLSLLCGTIHCFAQPLVLIFSYPYLQKMIAAEGMAAAILDIVICLGVFFASVVI